MIWPEPKNVWSTAFIVYTATVGFFGPLLIICLCYLLIVIKVCISVCIKLTNKKIINITVTPSLPESFFFCPFSPHIGEVLRGASWFHQASPFRAQGDADGCGDRGGLCALLAAILYHQHGQSGRHHPRIKHYCRHLLLCRHPVLCQLLCQPSALWLPVGQPEAELQKSRLNVVWV